MRLSDLDIGTIIVTGDGYAFIVAPSPDGKQLTDGDMSSDCDSADAQLEGLWSLYDPALHTWLDHDHINTLRELCAD